ncbi:MAG TPA: glycosyl hydrolase, partial [Opitutus sp.]|nr:glycosyl hydrolase [Opitutus sp.]
MGSIGDEKTLTTEMEKYAAIGFGGLEITPIYGVRGQEDRFVSFLSPTWMRNFEHTLAEGRRLGLGIDLATGTGWPFGGPWIDDGDAAHYLAHKVYRVSAGARPAEPVEYIQRELIRHAGPRRTPVSALKQPVTANANLQDLAIDQVRFAQPLPIVSVMAFPADGEPLDITARVQRDGQLDWTAPADRGTWTVYALFQGQHGKMVERAGPGGEGYALDHLSSSALERYLAKFDTAFANHATGGLRAFFNDSYEVDDADGEADFTPEFFTEFKQRRGYDLRGRLPDLFAATPTETSTRVLSDYRETVSDLLLDKFTTPWRHWANQRGALVRNQPHGSPANVLDLYAASDIPEQEGNGILAMKLASSAAHLTGKRLVSGETATWLNEHFLSTLADLKANVDTFLLGGINHNCYHGTPFSPPDEPWPGFQFYASVELSPTNPFWADLAIVNAYV